MPSQWSMRDGLAPGWSQTEERAPRTPIQRLAALEERYLFEAMTSETLAALRYEVYQILEPHLGKDVATIEIAAVGSTLSIVVPLGLLPRLEIRSST